MLKGYCLRKDNKLNFALLDKFQHGGFFFHLFECLGLAKT